jgi:hypothetical protein
MGRKSQSLGIDDEDEVEEAKSVSASVGGHLIEGVTQFP